MLASSQFAKVGQDALSGVESVTRVSKVRDTADVKPLIDHFDGDGRFVAVKVHHLGPVIGKAERFGPDEAV